MFPRPPPRSNSIRPLVEWPHDRSANGYKARPIPTEGDMNWAELQRDWRAAGPLLKTYWIKLTDSDLERIDGCRDKLAEALRRLYGYDDGEAEQAIASFEKDVRFPGAVK